MIPTAVCGYETLTLKFQESKIFELFEMMFLRHAFGKSGNSLIRERERERERDGYELNVVKMSGLECSKTVWAYGKNERGKSRKEDVWRKRGRQ